MDDTAGSSMLQQAGDSPRHTLTIAMVARDLELAGVPRSERRIKHYCQTSSLDAMKLSSPTGDQWFINPLSVPKLIGELRQWEAQKTSRLQHAAADPDSPAAPHKQETDAAGSSRLQPAATGFEQSHAQDKGRGDGGVMQPAAAAYVSQLEKRIEEKDDVISLLKGQLIAKDEQITRHSDRERETNLLIRGLQNLVLRLQPGRSQSADVFDGDPMMRGTDMNSAPPPGAAAGV